MVVKWLKIIFFFWSFLTKSPADRIFGHFFLTKFTKKRALPIRSVISKTPFKVHFLPLLRLWSSISLYKTEILKKYHLFIEWISHQILIKLHILKISFNLKTVYKYQKKIYTGCGEKILTLQSYILLYKCHRDV